MKSWRKLQVATLAIAACLSIGLQGSANASSPGDTAIMAHPTGCSNGVYTNGWVAKCKHSNGGKYRAWVRCLPLGGGPMVERDAPRWISSGPSKVFCPPLTEVENGGIWTIG